MKRYAAGNLQTGISADDRGGGNFKDIVPVFRVSEFLRVQLQVPSLQAHISLSGAENRD